MSQDNVEVVNRLYNECWASGKLDLVPEILHPEIVWTAIESAPDSGTRRGHEEVSAYMNDWLESFELEPVSIEEAGAASQGRFVCALRAGGTERRSGLTTEISFAASFRFAPDGRIIEVLEYATLEEAMEAVGMAE